MAGKDAFAAIDISTRPKRRRAVGRIQELLAAIMAAEGAYLGRMPGNFKGTEAAESAETSIDCISDAISILQDAY